MKILSKACVLFISSPFQSPAVGKLSLIATFFLGEPKASLSNLDGGPNFLTPDDDLLFRRVTWLLSPLECRSKNNTGLASSHGAEGVNIESFRRAQLANEPPGSKS